MVGGWGEGWGVVVEKGEKWSKVEQRERTWGRGPSCFLAPTNLD